MYFCGLKIEKYTLMAKYNLQIREEELKNKVAADFFEQFDTTQIVGNIDFSVALPMPKGTLDLFDADFFLWGEAKKGDKQDIDDSLVQLLITIIKAKTFNSFLPPLYLAAFDAEKIAFLPYDTDLQKQILFDEHLENTVDWKSVTPSDHHAAVFLKIKHYAAPLLEKKILFDYEKDEKDLHRFIRDNFKAQKEGTNKINITLNRMTAIFNRWLEIVKPTIKIDWTNLAKENIVPADFFLADALSKNNWSLGETLKVLLRTDFYMMNLKVKVGDALMDTFTNVQFTDKQKAHQAFWNRYNRPPSKREREKMQERRDLLIEPDRRERKGAFFTPHQWVELSQEYLAQTLGENWQEVYYVWDCCAGTGNLLYGLTEKERIFASTLDDADVRFMQQQDFLLPKHVFQFDFLNDDLQDADKVPADLRRILADEQLRKNLVIYINPPYAEAGNAKQSIGTGKNKAGVAKDTKTYRKYQSMIGPAAVELFAQFFIRVYDEIPGAVLAEFSTLKILQAPNFADFREIFRAELQKAFIVPSYTFDNVKGQFPIGFFIWDTMGTQPSSSAGSIGAQSLSAAYSETRVTNSPANSETRVTNSPAPLAGRGIQGAGKEKEQQRTINWGHNSHPQPKIMNSTEMREYRRELRKHGTPAEGALWNILKAKQVAGLQFRRQFSVGQYILDFYCPALRLAIELDGDYHYHWMQPELDYERERILWEQYNIRVIRFENKVVFQNPQAIVDAILKHKEVMDYAKEDGEYLKWLAEEYHSTASPATSDACTVTPLTSIAPPPNPLPASGVGELITSDYTDTIGIPKEYILDVYESKGEYIGQKIVSSVAHKNNVIGKWMIAHNDKAGECIGMMNSGRNDFQNTKYNYIANSLTTEKTHASILRISANNLHIASIYFAVRHVIPATWLNDRDQFLYPNEGWKSDYEFQADCLAYTLFNNNIQSEYGINHWIPFTEKEVGAQSLFASHFMSDYLAGKLGARTSSSASQPDLFSQLPSGTSQTNSPSKLEGAGGVCQTAELENDAGSPLQNMSEQARAVMDAGRELWRYYHSQADANADASYYDIRRYFQGTDEKGRMNPDSEDKEYMHLWNNLKAALKLLAEHIEPKVYKYGFLLGSNLQTEAEQSLFE